MERIPTRMGDGSMVHLTRDEIEADVLAGTEAGAKRAKVEPLRDDEVAHLVDIFASPARFSAVDIGDEVILSSDGVGSQDVGSRINDLQNYEQTVCTDTVELYHHDYSFKPIKPVLPFEQETMRRAQLLLTVPCQYGAMPDLGRYTVPDGPIPNWSQLLPLGRIDEARAAQEEAVEHAVDDIVYVADGMYEAGADGINLDTAGAAGDADFLAALRAIERIRARYPDWGIQIGMASEFVLGMHGELEYDGVRLAGLWPAAQMRPGGQGRRLGVRPGRQRQHRQDGGLERGAHVHHRQAVHRRRRDPGPPQRGDGRGRRAHARAAAGGRRLARLTRGRRHPAARRLVDRRRRQPQPGDRPRCRVGHGRIADRRRSGGPHADDPTDAAPRGEGLRGRQARREPVPT